MGKKIEETTNENISDEKNKIDNNKHIFTNFVVVVTLISSLVYFFINITNTNSSIESLINCSILVLFTIIFLVVCLTIKKKKKLSILVCSILLLSYFIYNINNSINSKSTTKTIIDFRGKNLIDVVKWAKANNINIEQDYEYSDMIPEYTIISQNIDSNSNLKDIDSIKVSISEGPNPYKEIIIPSMITWDDERVINFVKTNYLSNVVVDFVDSDKKKDTVIEQSKSGNLKRDEELKLTFSYGDEGNSDEVKLIELTNKSKFEIEFYMKQHHLKYRFEYDFSDKVKKDHCIKQSVNSGDVVKVDDKEIIVTLSKGKEIKVPELKNMSIDELTEWAVKNKVKLEFTDKYDEEIKEGNVISCDKNKDDIIEQGTTIKVIISRGALKMPHFNNPDEFYDWANKYEIKYDTKREFSNTVNSGDIISFSVKEGKAIKNDETIVITISDGKNCEVPNLKNLSKSDAISKLKKADLNYYFVYKNSDKDRDMVINQSMSSGSEVSCGTTVTVTLSSGKKEESVVERREEIDNNNNNDNDNDNKDNNNNKKTEISPSPSPTPTKTCNSCVILKSLISSSIDGYSTCSAASSNLQKQLEASCKGLTVNVSCENVDGFDTNDFVRGFTGGKVTSCDTISIVLAK